ncbi:Lipopolysaccharide export LptBFGC system [Commensalibacter communis]|uniref:Permease protein LptF (LptF) n=1 Tax=Commensalibacter communis TaxID=2972786 RepID=A0A9W4XHY0_9PROT|nr:LptF/LptG family permease [Commensalibacter communis]CAI3937745.1 Lipopolysaccharide export LptBFGC system [Commensalibacter communis]CAI3940966.1 Lipopolysaccharide export LptBFGC system [Commensalibacter communis]CAI3942598.1 Lipopolysaccharide export LptBFGC system [Commensalibacter communis]CAI3948900.1 Lipopolysaccharide export LptBFGC system [Commensalibacter communis]
MFRRHQLIIYLSLRLLSIVLGTAILLTIIMEALTLLEQMSPILARHLGWIGIAHYMGLRLPLLFSSVLPLSMLIGTIVMLTRLTLNNEVTIFKAAGLSSLGFITKLLPAAILLGVICFIFHDQITPKSELNLAIWWNKTDPTPEKGKGFYFYQNLDIVSVDYIAYGGNTIKGLTIYKRKDLSHLDSILTAETAQYSNKRWLLSNAKILLIAPGVPLEFTNLTKPEEMIWETPLTPRTLIGLSVPALPQSLHIMLKQLSNAAEPFRIPTNTIKTTIWARLFIPFMFIVMLIIAIPVTSIPPRAGLKSWLPVYCLGAGLLFIIFQEVLRALGKAGTLPAPIAVIPSLLIFILAASAIILMIEEKT